MEKERPTRGHRKPSFSSTLVDAIDRSIDESGGGRGPDSSVASNYHNTFEWRAPEVALPASYLHVSASRSAKSSYIDLSSSSSQHNSSVNRGTQTSPIRTEASRSTPLQAHRYMKTKSTSIRSKACDPRQPKAPASPGGRLAGFLNYIFASGAGKSRKERSPTLPASGEDGDEDSICSTASSSYFLSCLAKTTSSSRQRAAKEGATGKRSVRFDPASAGDQADVEEGRRREEARNRVEELLRWLEAKKEAEETSDSSSDLFELENFAAAGAGQGWREDELPVYGTTRLGTTDRAISSSGLMLNY